MGFRSKQTVRRTTGGYYDNDGMWNAGTSETIQIMASVQPLNSSELAQYVSMMPEGDTNYNAVKIYSDTQLRVEKQEQDGNIGVEADVLVWRGHLYKVVMCEEWQSNVISHFRMIAWEVGSIASNDTQVST